MARTATRTISDIITAGHIWADLSDRAQARIRATRAHLLRRYQLVEEGYGYDVIEAGSIEEALQEARDNVSRDNYGDAEGTIYIDVRVENVVTGEEAEATVTLDEPEPDCVDDAGHDWQSPIDLVGGVKENPGVFLHGGGVYVHEACMRCGCKRTTDTWAQRRDTGEQGLTEVSYERGYYDVAIED